jgi:Xaa-Pro aminopeptidase
MFDLASVQSALRDQGLDGWLLYDFRGLNVLARRVLAISAEAHATRRWFYFIPATGEPRKLVHRIESGVLDAYPGSKQVYLRWQSLEEGVLALVAGRKRIAMEYSPRNANPYISRVDAGTVELVKSSGVEIMPSGDLIQLFEACWDDEQWAMHREAARHTDAAYAVAWRFIADRVRSGKPASETEVQAVIMDHFSRNGLITDHPPIVGVGPHSGDPHFAPSKETDSRCAKDAFVLIDLWAKLDRPNSVYSDLTRTGFVSESVPEEYQRIFQIVARARDAAIERVRKAYATRETLQGWQVDQAARDVIEQAGYGEAFCHRTGHSIGQETHGNGANMDNLETHETRRVMPRTCFSVEPGIYLSEFGVRSEINVFIDREGTVHVTGGELQESVIAVLKEY